MVEIERKRLEGEIRYEEMERKEREKQRREKWEKIRESRYVVQGGEKRWYSRISEERMGRE